MATRRRSNDDLPEAWLKPCLVAGFDERVPMPRGTMGRLRRALAIASTAEHDGLPDQEGVNRSYLRTAKPSTDEVVAEAFRLSAMRNQPGEKGWHLHSNVVRAGKLLAKHTRMTSSAGDPTTFASFIRNSPNVEGLVDRRDVLFIRPKPIAMDLVDGRPNRVVARTLCAFDAAPRDFGEFDTFTEARQAILRCPTALVTHRTTIAMTRGDERLDVFFDASTRRWRVVGDGFLKGIHPGEKQRYAYRNGHLVGGLVGYVTINRRGLIHATVGKPFDSEGDEDASVSLVNRREAADVTEALNLLRTQGDLDHVFTEPVTVGSMGVWLTCLADAAGDVA